LLLPPDDDDDDDDERGNGDREGDSRMGCFAHWALMMVAKLSKISDLPAVAEERRICRLVVRKVVEERSRRWRRVAGWQALLKLPAMEKSWGSKIRRHHKFIPRMRVGGGVVHWCWSEE
jgi:hypothetical protein